MVLEMVTVVVMLLVLIGIVCGSFIRGGTEGSGYGSSGGCDNAGGGNGGSSSSSRGGDCGGEGYGQDRLKVVVWQRWW